MIKLLSKDLINKIAAGEVVERPASVVKELLENALDASATAITVKIKAGGMERISIEDNGTGIIHDDTQVLFRSHATSKIQTIEDLTHIQTFGFRGEALASIASVAQVTLITRNIADTIGTKVTVKDKEITYSAAAANIGTVIEISSLFYNVPARRKFMKSEKTEFSYIMKIFQEIALINPHVSLTLHHNDKQICMYKKGSQEERIHDIIRTSLLPPQVLYDAQDIQIQAALVKPGSLEKGMEQYIYVNHRIVNSALIAKAIKDAYTSFLRSDIRPSYVLLIQIDPELVDVNVHPRKIEIRFVNQQEIYQHVFQGVLRAFERANTLSINQAKKDHVHKGLLDDTISRESQSTKISSSISSGIGKKYLNKNKKSEPYSIPSALSFSEQLLHDASPVLTHADLPQSSFSVFDEVTFLQVDKKFIVFGYDQELHIVDQHAASERVNYEKLQEYFANKDVAYNVALFPLHVDISISDYHLALSKAEIFSQYGIDIEDMGNDMLAITRFINLIPENKITAVFLDILGQLKLTETTKEKTFTEEKLIASMACRSAIMFNQSLSQDEMRHVAKELFSCKTPFSCAHGRPVQYVISYEQLVKKMGRC